MNHFVRGFGDELTKVAVLGALKTVGGFVKRHPGLSINAPIILGATALAARSGYKSGRRGDEKPRYLPASYDPIARTATPSQAAYIPYGRLFGKPSEREAKKVSKNYKEKAFKG